MAERAASPLGEMILVTDTDQRLRAVEWLSHEARLHALLARQFRRSGYLLEAGPPTPASRALALYFQGDLRAIDALAVEAGGSEFQSAVWQALRAIPPGETITYRELAARAGRPAAIRAAGAANGANPINIVIPCHRVIGTDGKLTGYGGGVERKRWLLAHEASKAFFF